MNSLVNNSEKLQLCKGSGIKKQRKMNRRRKGGDLSSNVNYILDKLSKVFSVPIDYVIKYLLKRGDNSIKEYAQENYPKLTATVNTISEIPETLKNLVPDKYDFYSMFGLGLKKKKRKKRKGGGIIDTISNYFSKLPYHLVSKFLNLNIDPKSYTTFYKNLGTNHNKENPGNEVQQAKELYNVVLNNPKASFLDKLPLLEGLSTIFGNNKKEKQNNYGLNYSNDYQLPNFLFGEGLKKKEKKYHK